MNRIQYYVLKYKPYLVGVFCFSMLFVVWWLGVQLGYSTLMSLLTGIGVFLMSSSLYVLLLHRGDAQYQDLELLLRDDADQAVLNASPGDREEISLLRERLLQSIARLCAGTRGRRSRNALYALSWYLVIGQPASGKSSLLLQSGLHFPYAEREGMRTAGLGGTRNCDWFFSAEAVLLDTAGRYMGSPEEAGRWRGFLALLRQHRPQKPLNGLIVTVSLDDLLNGTPLQCEQLAKRLRERVQEAQALLELTLPIYLVFTKCDLLPGFSEFYRRGQGAGQESVLGATFPHADYVEENWHVRFSQALETWVDHWQGVAAEQLVQQDIRVTREDPTVYRFPLELKALKPVLCRFVAALLQANPYQQAALLRGFYFTSALDAQCLDLGAHARSVGQRFALNPPQASVGSAAQPQSLFIQSLFQKVIIPDQHLVALYSRNRREDRRVRGWRIGGAAWALTVCGAWGVAYWQNTSAIAALSLDLVVATERDAAQPGAYAAWQRLDRLRESAAQYHSQHQEAGVPWSLRLGLYQGRVIEPRVRERYFAELQQVMLSPTGDNLTRSLTLLPTIKVYQRNDKSQHPVTGIDSVEPRALPQDNRASSIAQFGKTTLETYQMLSKSREGKGDPAFLKQALPDYWYPTIARHVGVSSGRGQSEAPDYLYAGRQIAFYSEQINEPDAPRIMGNAFLVSSSRNYINSLLAQSLRAIETITLESDTLFAFGRADLQSLQESGRQQLSQIAAKLLNTPNVGTVVITGHADQIGDADSNLRVSRQRAETIKTYLVGKGVPQELVTALGEGSLRPLVRCDTALPRADLISCLEPNRRVEIEVRAQP